MILLFKGRLYNGNLDEDGSIPENLLDFEYVVPSNLYNKNLFSYQLSFQQILFNTLELQLMGVYKPFRKGLFNSSASKELQEVGTQFKNHLLVGASINLFLFRIKL